VKNNITYSGRPTLETRTTGRKKGEGATYKKRVPVEIGKPKTNGSSNFEWKEKKNGSAKKKKYVAQKKQ